MKNGINIFLKGNLRRLVSQIRFLFLTYKDFIVIVVLNSTTKGIIMDIIKALNKIGFTNQEALIYIELYNKTEITGYEVAKITGISRSNAYTALSHLVDKGYAYTVEGTPVKYVAVPKEDLIKNSKREYDKALKVIEKELISDKSNQTAYITIKGKKNIYNKLRNIIDGAKERIYLASSSHIVGELKEQLNHCIDRGLKVVVISDNSYNLNFTKFYHKEDISSIKLIVDTKEVIAGTTTQCLYSKNETLVAVIREALINEIDVLTMKGR